eukprot:CAMPEP_0118882934 /NCGR_PEP_ID=MMETSP1163-20130328/22078_1 /TAXON_ID=124430 /ORGANISM="Phaeomonas parva, Strain CCMP2877" /LENGTH=370 /DNA_ID=CAMNT_0006820165 /DNA_START=269 /DNA_END=1378 /DNA_ORIENTATION=+
MRMVMTRLVPLLLLPAARRPAPALHLGRGLFASRSPNPNPNPSPNPDHKPNRSPDPGPTRLFATVPDEAEPEAPRELKKPNSLSPTAINDFTTCPMLFRFRYLDRRPEPVTPVLARGNIAHDALFEYYGLSRELRTRNNLQNLFRLSWLKAKQGKVGRNGDQYATLFKTVEEERDWGLHGLELLENYLELEDPTSFDPLSRELPLVYNITEDCSLHGIIDRVDVDEDGNLAVIDYKTGKAPDLKYSTAMNRKILNGRFMQLRTYALLLAENQGRAPIVLKLLYLDGPSLLWMPCNQDEVEKTRDEILKSWEAIIYRVNRQHFEPTVNKLCDYCVHKSVCPAWTDGGDYDSTKKSVVLGGQDSAPRRQDST